MECFAVSSSADESTYIWSVANLTVHHNVKANAANVNGSCLVGRHGEILISSQVARPAIHVYTLGSAESPLKCPMPEKMCLAASRDGSFLFGGGKSGKIYVWALGSGVLLNVFDGHFREVACLAVTTDGACLVSGGDDGVVHAWMVSALVDSSANSKPVALHSWTGHGLKISCLFCAVGPLGETVVLSASLDCTVKMWRMGDGALVSDVAFPGAVTSLAMDAFEEYLFAGSVDGSIYCVNFRHNSVERQMAVSEIEGDEERLKNSFRSVLSAHTGEVTVLCVASIAGGKQALLSGSKDGAVHVWDISSGELVSTFKKHNGSSVQSICLLWASVGCVLNTESKSVVVGKLHKFQSDDASGLSWVCVPQFRKVEEKKTALALFAQQGVGSQETRIKQLESENAELQEANKRLYEFNVEKILTNKQKGLLKKKKKKQKTQKTTK